MVGWLVGVEVLRSEWCRARAPWRLEDCYFSIRILLIEWWILENTSIPAWAEAAEVVVAVVAVVAMVAMVAVVGAGACAPVRACVSSGPGPGGAWTAEGGG